ncbi:ribonuclease H-like domain-containing protein, partial [Mycena crocata]
MLLDGSDLIQTYSHIGYRSVLRSRGLFTCKHHMELAADSSPPEPSSIPPLTTRYTWQSGSTRRWYLTDADEADEAVSRFTGPCGIDIEWKPTFRKGQAENPVALLQLANVDTVLLLHLCHMKRFPKNLQTFLEDPTIIKAGVGIQGDAKKVYKDCSVNIRSCVDLSLLARCVDNTRWKGKYSDPIGLARLIATYEDRLLSKGKVTRSNWENLLSVEQQEYASNDGHAGYILYMKLSSMILTTPKLPDPTCYTFDAIRGRLCEASGTTWLPFNPDYDPGPPPLPRPVLASAIASAHPTLLSSIRRLMARMARM